MVYSVVAQIAGSLTAAGTICTLPVVGSGTTYQNIRQACFWTFELDAEDVGTAAIVVAIQTYNLNKAAYFAPSTPAWNAISVTNATKQIISYTGPLAGAQIVIASFGTSTGTFRGHIIALG